MSDPNAIAPGAIHVRLHAGDPGDAPVPDDLPTVPAADFAPANPFERPALATEELSDGTIRHTSWWWPDGRQATWADLESAHLAAEIRQAMAHAARWRSRVARALWQATRGGRR